MRLGIRLDPVRRMTEAVVVERSVVRVAVLWRIARVVKTEQCSNGVMETKTEKLTMTEVVWGRRIVLGLLIRVVVVVGRRWERVQ